MVGTIFDLPDDMRLQRGMTFTILPDGRMLRVPAMSRIEVRAHADSHEQDGGNENGPGGMRATAATAAAVFHGPRNWAK